MIPAAKIVLLFNYLLLTGFVLGAPIKREVPQEHSHNEFLASVRTSLQANNPNQIDDPVFGLLGNAAAAGGAGKITDLDCLHLATADQAFTNAKAAGDVQAMSDALVYAALERNTGSVGLASNLCTSIKAVNPEVQAISQHQDPASANAATINKGIALELAKQIASIGGNPQDAIKSGTFAPGNLDDKTGKGNTCDVADDTTGCIFTQNLLVPDVTAQEIDDAVAGISASGSGSGSAASAASSASPASSAAVSSSSTADASAETSAAVDNAVSNSTSTCPPAVTVTVTASAEATSTAAASSDAATASTANTTTASSGTAATSSSTLDFGSCSNPTIEFGGPFDGRTENSFEPENSTDFNHGSALNIKIIADFICQQLQTSCKASAAAVTACNNGEAAAIATGGTTGSAADAFNAALGFTTDFATNPIGGAAASASSGAVDNAATAATTTSAAAAAAATTAAASGSSASAAASTSGNLQAFTGALGNILPPPVTQTGSAAQPFCVQGNACFQSEQDALVRSCDVQHNLCANASNAAGQNAPFSVNDCQTQQNTCDAAAGSA